jgi:hypothetical protein
VNQQQRPELAPPGNGLPPVEAWVTRSLLFPLYCRATSWQKALTVVTRLGHQAISMLLKVDDQARETRVLIKRQPGLEDSSRYWSLAMVVDHLLITGEGMAGTTEGLVAGAPLHEVRIQDVKPQAERSVSQIITAYEAFLDGYPSRMKALPTQETFLLRRHPHPWFWPMNAHEWACLNAMHHQIHLNQMAVIQKTLARVST